MVLQYIPVLQYVVYMLLMVLHYIEGLLGYVTSRCSQNFEISKIYEFTVILNYCPML